MRRVLLVVILVSGVIAASSLLTYSRGVAAAASESTAVFDADGKCSFPWVTDTGFSSVPR